jgi:hypothetical protein
MAILHQNVLNYFDKVFSDKVENIDTNNDPILALFNAVLIGNNSQNKIYFPDKVLNKASNNYNLDGFLGLIQGYFNNKIIVENIGLELERKIFILKKGLKQLPSTTASIILKGFGYDISPSQIISVYKSYGFAQGQKYLSETVDFLELNRRVQGFSELLTNGTIEEKQKIQQCFEIFWPGNKYTQTNINKLTQTKSRTLVYYYQQNVSRLGAFGFFVKSKNSFKESKITATHEAKIILKKIQYPEYKEKYFIDYLNYNDIKVKTGTVSKIFKRWNADNYKSAYKGDLERLLDNEYPGNSDDGEITEIQKKEKPILIQDKIPDRLVNKNFLILLKSLEKSSLNISSPGLFIIWYYIEKLGLYKILENLGLTHYKYIYNWSEYLFFSIGRIYQGTSTYSGGCYLNTPDIPFFSALIKPPCPAKFLDGLDSITQEQVFTIQQWLINRAKELNLIKGQKIAFDFHKIDLDIDNSRLKQITKGPSPKKKICYNGFRPHIAWDIETGSLMVVEFRKGAARGTSTIKKFIKDFLVEDFKDIFEQIYIDSEYTGKDVWNYILDENQGLGANLTACLKQNKLVKKHRDEFLIKNKIHKYFWKYWDSQHVYSSSIFKIEWEINSNKKLHLNVVVKKNIKNGNLRCFASSICNEPKQILEDYSNRWVIENGIKDLSTSFFLDKIPGTDPHSVNIHFLIVSICKIIYKMIERDGEGFILNYDGTIKTLHTLRPFLINQGNAKLSLKDDTLEINYSNSFSEKNTKLLKQYYDKITDHGNRKLEIMGGLKLKFNFQIPWGNEYKNSNEHVILDMKKI